MDNRKQVFQLREVILFRKIKVENQNWGVFMRFGDIG